MKKLLKGLLLLMCLFICSGCLDLELKMQINKDKSMDFDFDYRLDISAMMDIMYTEDNLKELACQDKCPYSTDSSEYETCLNACSANLTDEDYKQIIADQITEETMSEEEKQEYIDAGFNITSNLDKENFIYTVNLNKHFSNIDEVSTPEDNINMYDYFSNEFAGYLFTKTSNNTYKAYLKDESTELDDTDTSDDLDLNPELLKNFMTYKFTVTLPTKAISENATSKSADNLTLTWDLTKIDNVSFEFAIPTSNSKSSNSNFIDNLLTNITPENQRLLSYGLIGGGIFTLIITVVLFIKSSKKTK